MDNFRYILFPVLKDKSESIKEPIACYQMWHSVWSQTLYELDGLETVYSDQFTRQDYVGAIFDKEQCAALCCFRQLDLSNPMFYDDSWFEAWPKSQLQRIQSESSKILLASWLTVAPKYRKVQSNDQTHIGQVLADLTALNLLSSQSQVMLGTSRNERGVDKLCLNVGGAILSQSVAHGVSVCLFVFTPRAVSEAYEVNMSFTSKRLWKQRQWLGETPMNVQGEDYDFAI